MKENLPDKVIRKGESVRLFSPPRYNRCNEGTMSVIEDTRKVLPDFLAPEMRELSARVDALEGRMKARFDSAERLASERHAQSVLAIGRLANVFELRERVARIEARERPS